MVAGGGAAIEEAEVNRARDEEEGTCANSENSANKANATESPRNDQTAMRMEVTLETEGEGAVKYGDGRGCTRSENEGGRRRTKEGPEETSGRADGRPRHGTLAEPVAPGHRSPGHGTLAEPAAPGYGTPGGHRGDGAWGSVA